MQNKVELLDVSTDLVSLGGYVGICRDAKEKDTYEEELVACQKRIENCLKLEHDSVFEFLTYVFKVECSIRTARQLMRHRNGVFLERSMRSCKPLEYVSDGTNYDNSLKTRYDAAVNYYNYEINVWQTAKEEARDALPLCSPTRFVWQISFRSLMNLFKQRLTKAAQKETRDVVRQMFCLCFSDEDVLENDIQWLPKAWCERAGRDFDKIATVGYSD